MSTTASSRRSSFFQSDRALTRQPRSNSIHWSRYARIPSPSPCSSQVQLPSIAIDYKNKPYTFLYPQHTDRTLSLNSPEKSEIPSNQLDPNGQVLAPSARSRSLPLVTFSRIVYRRASSGILDGSFEEEEEEAQVRRKGSSSRWRLSLPPRAAGHLSSATDDLKPDRIEPRPSLRERFAMQVQESRLFNIAKPSVETEEGSGPSSRIPGTPLAFRFNLPSFSAARAMPASFSPLVSPRGTPSGPQKGFFDYVSMEKDRYSSLSPMTLVEALQSTPDLPTQPQHKDQFRVSVFGEQPRSNVDLVSQLPDHLPSSPLCPRHPKHKSGGRGRCPVHGRNRLSEDSLSEEHEPVIRRRKDLQLFL